MDCMTIESTAIPGVVSYDGAAYGNVGDGCYPVMGALNVKGEGFVPVLDLPQMSDYDWQLCCLNDRLEHPQKYEGLENVAERIAHLRSWLKKHEADTRLRW